MPETEKASAVWTYTATITLLKLYENNLGLLETPKKKTRIWVAISKSLRDFNIEMSADQVRWKINALTKRYKQCVDIGQPVKFKYFKEMDDIYAKHNLDCDTFVLGDCIDKKKYHQHGSTNNFNPPIQINSESKVMIELRKARFANRIESDRTQSKLYLEKQWLEYLKGQEQERLLQDKLFVQNLKLREEELDLRRQELEIKESVELRKLLIKDREQDELLRIEKEKCEMLEQFLHNKDDNLVPH
ncbi:uncharacterized protein LOC120624449 isoform X2 [Pararge aegeria]|uniref:Jg21285 protein n=1 Tax=Pararge aegeria aegeria TaxID=348720 RepID=A0A8S4SF89_9NEOP|nr:uncharacterized protein LOC120624449 isoform X2 [Pararge aegeria]CAH2264552.1 jg21285 [Pararge aegeria aegeria]